MAPYLLVVASWVLVFWGLWWALGDGGLNASGKSIGKWCYGSPGCHLAWLGVLWFLLMPRVLLQAHSYTLSPQRCTHTHKRRTDTHTYPMSWMSYIFEWRHDLIWNELIMWWVHFLLISNLMRWFARPKDKQFLKKFLTNTSLMRKSKAHSCFRPTSILWFWASCISSRSFHHSSWLLRHWPIRSIGSRPLCPPRPCFDSSEGIVLGQKTAQKWTQWFTCRNLCTWLAQVSAGRWPNLKKMCGEPIWNEKNWRLPPSCLGSCCMSVVPFLGVTLSSSETVRSFKSLSILGLLEHRVGVGELFF